MKRFSDRVQHDLNAELLLDKDRHKVTIENFSEDGIFLRTDPIDNVVDFSKDTILDLLFEIPSGERLKLHCKVMWSNTTSSASSTNTYGLKIIENSPMYEEYYKSLFFMDNSMIF